MGLGAVRRFFPSWRPSSILYEVTARCNLQCPHCYNIWKATSSGVCEELSTDRARALIQKAVRESRCQQVLFTGGEPLLRGDLEQLVSCARALCPGVGLITNGTLLNESRIKALVAAGVSLFELPLNSADRTMHDRMAGGAACFDRVMQAAADIRYHGGTLAFVFVGTADNIGHWKGVLELGVALGSRNFLFNRYNAGGVGHRTPEQLMPTVSQIREGLCVAEEFARACPVGISASIAIPPCLIDPSEFPHVGFGFCAAGTGRAYYTLDPMGNVRPCNHTSTVLGNLFETPLRKLAHSPRMKSFKLARPAFCAGCAREEDCLGGCKAAAEVCYGSLTACDPFLELNKGLVQRPKAGG